MPETPTASDLEKAHLILSEFGLLIGPVGEMSDVIARSCSRDCAWAKRSFGRKAPQKGMNLHWRGHRAYDCPRKIQA